MVKLTTDTVEDDKGWVALNGGYEEENQDADGELIPDNKPDPVAGDRIVADDEDLSIGKLITNASSTSTGQWKLTFPNKIKVWRNNGSWTQVTSDTSYNISSTGSENLAFEGVSLSTTDYDIPVTATFTPQGSTSSATHTINLMVVSGEPDRSDKLDDEDTRDEEDVDDFPDDIYPTPTPTPEAWWEDGGGVTPGATPVPTYHSPVVEIVGPTAKLVQTLSTIQVKASDEEGNGGISRIAVRVVRSTDGRFWNPTDQTWDEEDTNAVLGVDLDPTQNNPIATWTCTQGPPSSQLIPGKQYIVTVAAKDAVGQVNGTKEFYTIQTSNADTTRPMVSIDTPGDQSPIDELGLIEGTVIDSGTQNGASSGASQVKVKLARWTNSGPYYWSGTAWVGQEQTLNAYLSGPNFRNWTVSTDLPQGTDLLAGTYFITVTAKDNANNFSFPETSIVYVGQNAIPRATILSPVPGVIGSFYNVRGTAIDADGSSDIASVTVQLQRMSDGMYWSFLDHDWNGSFSRGRLDAQLFPDPEGTVTEWICTTTPELSFLTEEEDSYQLQVIVSDKEGHTSSSTAYYEGGQDLQAGPQIALLSPEAGTTVYSLALINGTAAVSSADNVVDCVRLYLKRNDGMYWNGEDWISTKHQATLLATLSPGATSFTKNWVLSSGPSSDDLSSDYKYAIFIEALDKFGRMTQYSGALTDYAATGTPPSATVSQPSTGNVASSLNTIAGSATDVDGNTTIDFVDVTIQRLSDNCFWDGGNWVSEESPINATVSKVSNTIPASWSVEGPPASQISAGLTYRISIKVIDRVGLSGELIKDYIVPN